ncbi:MAG: helix-turn-helix transcriptional regulator [Nitrospiraceae bacterium]|nr:helix-turn-helix transcriptional regulator [Nitrospiraceae bacterium]
MFERWFKYAAKSSPRPGQSAGRLARQRQILEAASRVFRRKGLHATGMRDVAAELGDALAAFREDLGDALGRVAWS